MSLKIRDVSERMTLYTRKWTPSEVRRMRSACESSKGAAASLTPGIMAIAMVRSLEMKKALSRDGGLRRSAL